MCYIYIGLSFTQRRRLSNASSFATLFSLTRCFSGSDTIGDLKKIIAGQTGTKAEKIVLKKWYVMFSTEVIKYTRFVNYCEFKEKCL